MRFEFAHGGKVHAVELKAAGADRHRVRWSVRAAGGGAVEAEREFELDARVVGEGCYSVIVGDEVHDVRVERGGGDGGRRVVELEDGAVVLEHLDPLRPSGRKGGAAGPATVVSSIPGRVVRVAVRVGDVVDEGQPVVVLEAMKMANELRSPNAGRVAAVKVSTGAAVEAGAPLVVVEPREFEA